MPWQGLKSERFLYASCNRYHQILRNRLWRFSALVLAICVQRRPRIRSSRPVQFRNQFYGRTYNGMGRSHVDRSTSFCRSEAGLDVVAVRIVRFFCSTTVDKWCFYWRWWFEIYVVADCFCCAERGWAGLSAPLQELRWCLTKRSSRIRFVTQNTWQVKLAMCFASLRCSA